jgi:hypothetical protein
MGPQLRPGHMCLCTQASLQWPSCTILTPQPPTTATLKVQIRRLGLRQPAYCLFPLPHNDCLRCMTACVVWPTPKPAAPPLRPLHPHARTIHGNTPAGHKSACTRILVDGRTAGHHRQAHRARPYRGSTTASDTLPYDGQHTRPASNLDDSSPDLMPQTPQQPHELV